VSTRIELGPLSRNDLAVMPWLERAEGPRTDALAIRRTGDSTPIGVLSASKGRPAEGWSTIDWLELAPDQRGWGYGSDAIRLLEARQKNVAFLAEVDPLNGLALYFWLRLGYRPARSDEIFWRDRNERSIISMVHLPG
jgi:GNAT superfamily N-acetyltransferase